MKMWTYIILATIIIAALGTTSTFIFDAGYDKRDLEIQQEISDAVQQARKEEERRWKKTVADAEATIVIEEKIVEKIREVEKRVPYEVKKIVTITPECADLGDSYAGLLNEQIDASNSIQGESSDSTSIVVNGVPGAE